MFLKTQIKIFIDHLLFVTLGKILWLFFKPYRKNFNWELSQVKTVAVCKFKGMGSIIQSTALLHEIKKREPSIKVVYISTFENKPLLEKINLIDSLLFINDDYLFKLITSVIRSIIYLRKNKIDFYIDLELHSDFSGFFTFFSGAKVKTGFVSESKIYRSVFFNRLLNFNPVKTLSELYLSSFSCEEENTAFNQCEKKYPDYLYRFTPEKGAGTILQEKIKNLQPLFLNDKCSYIVINPNASDLRIERRWSAIHFALLIELILTNFPETNVVITGNRKERVYTENLFLKISGKFRERVLNTAGMLSLNELLALLEMGDLFITNDSGPMHLAFSMNIKTIALFGPCQPQFYNIPAHCSIFYKPVSCSPCVHTFLTPPCHGDNLCMKSIRVEKIFEKVMFYQLSLNSKFKPAIF